MKATDLICQYFAEHAGSKWNPDFPLEIIAALNHLNNPDRRDLRSKLFNEAKKIQLKNPEINALDWLHECFNQIDRHTFRLHQVYFSPGFDILDNLRDLIYQAKETLDLCVFSITDERLAFAIKQALKRSVSVRLITDDMKIQDTGSQVKWLKELGVKIKTDESRFHMHNKFGIMDRRISFTGSFNWTKTATRANQENLLVTTNHSIVQQFHEEFERLWEEMHKY